MLYDRGDGLGPILALAVTRIQSRASLRRRVPRHAVALLQEDVLMYLGPDVLMPIASAIAAVAGALLLAGRRTVDVARKLLKGIARVFGGR